MEERNSRVYMLPRIRTQQCLTISNAKINEKSELSMNYCWLLTTEVDVDFPSLVSVSRSDVLLGPLLCSLHI
jgi:hypothetical protein